MEKRYQVFISSTFDDLKNERSKVIQTLMEMDCIPSGMELFPAADEEQWEFIKKVIDDCDYYLLIIGGKYGTIGSDGLSYTEKEYDYAVEKGLKIIALLHEKIDDLPIEKKESDTNIKDKLLRFREKVAAGRLVKFWTKPEDLAGMASLSLTKTIKSSPAIGWVRANEVSNEDMLKDLNDLRKENLIIKDRIAQYEKESKPKINDLAGITDKITMSGKYYNSFQKSYYSWKIVISWEEIFMKLSPYLLQHPNESYVKTILGSALSKMADKSSGSIDDQDFQTIKVQFMALGLIDVYYSKTVQGGMAWFWGLTPQGNKLLFELRTVRTAATK